MSLLPSSHRQFQLKDYWETFFQKRKDTFEWYGEYLDLCHVLHKYIKKQNSLLVVGCGNSKLSEDLYDVGFESIHNIDISEVVIKQMSSKNKSKRPLMTYKVVDMLEMPYKEYSYDCVIDKGTLDAICVNTEQDTIDKVDKMFTEIRRVLKSNGRYICVTLCQDHVRDQLLTKHSTDGWIIRCHVISNVGQTVGVASALPVFVFVMTKMASIPGRPPIQVFEYVTPNEEDKCVRVNDMNGLVEFVKNHQQYALVQHHLNSIHLDEQVCVDLWSAENSQEPRFTLRVVDISKSKAVNGLFAIFLVPQGRETIWTFSSEAGCQQLAESAGYQRLIIVTLHRGHTYQDIDSIKEEVSAKAIELAQNGLPEGKKWPVLSLGEGIGSRRVLTEGSSNMSGQYVVEENQDEEKRGIIRRLVFVDSPHLAQTEVLMTNKSRSSSKKKVKSGGSLMQFAYHELILEFHKVMLASLGLINGGIVGGVINVLIVGLGGGALPMFLKTQVPNVSQHVIELDSTLVDVAIEWFGLQPTTVSTVTESVGERKPPLIKERGVFHIIKGDGLQYITSLAETCKGVYHAIILDVDNKDVSSGLNSPPLSFTTPSFLTAVKTLLHTNGVFVTNLSARNKELERSVFNDICTSFSMVVSIPIPEYVHDIVMAFPNNTAAQLCDVKVESVNKKNVDGRPFVLSKKIKSNIDDLLVHCVNKEELIKELHEYLITGLIYC